MKKIALLLGICLMSVFIFGNAVTAADNFSLNISEGEFLNGSREVVFWSASKGEFELKLDGETLPGESFGALTLSFAAAEIDFTNNGFFYNKNLICNILKDKPSQRAALNFEFPDSGDIDITLLPSVGSDVLDVTKKYGEYNIDDLTVADVHIILPNGDRIKPTKVIKAMPIAGSAGVIESHNDYNSASLRIGDGWNATTGMGGSTPNVPVYLTFRFDAAQLNAAAGQSKIHTLDTTKLSDGMHSIVMFRDGEKLKTVNFTVDNTPPTFVSNIKFGQVVNKDFQLSIIAVDENAPVNISMKADGKPFTGGSLKDLAYGKHTITVVAYDQSGNTAAEAYQITVADDASLVSKNAVELSMNGRVRLPLVNKTAPQRLELFTYEPIQKIKAFIWDADKQKDYIFGTTTETNAALSPEHFFDLTVSAKEGAFKFEYQGTASENIDIAIYAKATKDENWHLVGKSPSGVKSVVTIEDTAPYVKDGIISLKATPNYTISTSNTLFWVTDTQYYSRFEDLYPTYESIVNYAVELFEKDKIGYFMHTGDVVDEISEATFAAKQYEFAASMQKIIDDAGIPNGIVSGNHDIVMATADHTLFNKYFGAERYASKPWYGGNLESNTSHFDLVTIGGYDFIFLYLGWGVEARPETIAWANNVLKQYQSRNAIISIHGYLSLDGKWQQDYAAPLNYTHTRAQEVWENIIVPNSNVQAVFCGHTPGVARTKRQVGETDRYVWEILADYQYAEAGTDPQHKLNGMSCDGEGYIRLVSFDGKKMAHTTYSPLHDDNNFYGDDKDQFTVDFALKETKHTLRTDAVSALSAYNKLEIETEMDENALVFSVEQAKSNGKVILIAEDGDGRRYDVVLKALDNKAVDLKVILGVIGGIILVTALVLVPMVISKKKEVKKK